ncbi:MAG: ABC transporter permease [Proteobacteria bacterium]|nr:ABC transporter permease [Pseudomonadota bacterium]
MPQFVLLWTDLAIWFLILAIVGYTVWVRRDAVLLGNWRKVFHEPPAMASTVVLLACLLVSLLDSIHLRPVLPPAPGTPPGVVQYDTQVISALDAALAGLVESREVTYSRPLAYVSFTKETLEVNGQPQRVAPRLTFGGAHLSDPDAQWAGDVAARVVAGGLAGLAATAVVAALLVAWLARGMRAGFAQALARIWAGEPRVAWRTALASLLTLGLLTGIAVGLARGYHVLGTDITGNDVLYQALKSIRTAFVIGTLSTLATLPLAVVLGIMAGYFKGWVDEAIQYVYTVLSSIPSILLIAACVLMVQVYLDKHPELFETAAQRADLKLFLLCLVLGATGWPTLCRLLRGDTLKLREMEYVQAATAFGVSHWRIMVRHIFPNVVHLILIVTVLSFSDLILYEAVLSYVGVGVDPSMNSFGGMINLARNEMARDPIVWWSFAAAFVFMVSLVLAVNLFADGVRDAFDPRAHATRPRLLRAKKKGA